MTYEENREWSDQFIPHIKQIVGPLLLTNAPLDIDRNEATDLIVLQVQDKRIAARMRDRQYWLTKRYRYEFTIRCSTENGGPTELDKILKGFGDWFFYGHADWFRAGVAHWHLINLDIFRQSDRSHGVLCRNSDGSLFMAYHIRKFPRDILLKTSDPDLFRPNDLFDWKPC